MASLLSINALIGLLTLVVLAQPHDQDRAGSQPDTNRERRAAQPTAQAEEGTSHSDSGDVYRELAEATGGVAYDGGFEHFGEFLDIALDSDGYRIAWVQTVANADASPVIIDVPIDISVSRVDFGLNHSKRRLLQMTVLRPDGRCVMANDPDAKFTEAPGGLRRVRVTQPSTGKWQMRIEGQGAFQAMAVAKTSMEFLGVDFTRLLPFGGPCGPVGEDVGPELLLNEEVYFSASFYRDVPQLGFDLIDMNGRPLEKLDADPGSLDGTGGVFTPRTLYERFLVRASGVDANGNPFQRVVDKPFSVVAFVVREDAQFRHEHRTDPLAPYRFEIRNEGKRERFQVLAETDSKLPIRLSHETVDVETGSSALVDIELLTEGQTPAHRESLMVTIIPASNPKALDVARITIGKDE